MGGGFTLEVCQRNVFFNKFLMTKFLFYIYFQVVGLILIILPVYSKFSQLLTSWPIIGGAIASGVFLMLIAIAGIYGAARHNQIILFFVSLWRSSIFKEFFLSVNQISWQYYLCIKALMLQNRLASSQQVFTSH